MRPSLPVGRSEMCPDDDADSVVCRLRKTTHDAYGIVPDIETPDVLIKGRIRQALNGDFVVVKYECDNSLPEQNSASEGKLIGRYKGIYTLSRL